MKAGKEYDPVEAYANLIPHESALKVLRPSVPDFFGPVVAHERPGTGSWTGSSKEGTIEHLCTFC